MATATTPTEIPSTPAAVAAAVLDAIEADPRGFGMGCWWSYQYWGETLKLHPGGDLCGSTLCAAGWTAHVTGWTLVACTKPVEVQARNDDDGTPRTVNSNLYATKGGRRRLISAVAADSLGLSPEETFWYSDDEEALARLREIAGRT